MECITARHDIMLGKPVVHGTRITVELIIRKLSEGASATDLVKMYPQLVEADIVAALQYATNVLSKEEFIPLAA